MDFISIHENDLGRVDRPAFVRGDRWLQWVVPPVAAGIKAWGSYTIENIDRTMNGWVSLIAGVRQPIDTIIDVGELPESEFRLEVFRHMHARAAALAPSASRAFRRQGFIVPDGAAGAQWIGVNASLQLAFPWACFKEHGDLWAFLETPKAVVDGVETMCTNERRRGRLLEDLADVLENDPFAKLSAVAAALGLGERAFQQELKELGTTFADARRGARLHHARMMLLEPDAKIEAVVASCGFGSRTHFFRWFKQATGSTPLVWRQRHLGNERAFEASMARS